MLASTATHKRGGPASPKESLRRRALVGWRAVWLVVGEYCHTSEWAAVAPWIGTLIGSWIVGANTGSVRAIILGAVIAGVGCAPVAASARWVRLRDARTRRQDARERKVMEFSSLVLLPQLGEFSHLRQLERIAARDKAVVETVEYLASKVYDDEESGRRKAGPSTRVVVHAIGKASGVLDVVHQAGRNDPAASLDLTAPGRGAKILADLLGGEPTYESELVGRGYRSYISAAISSDDVYGMISVDTTDVTQLDQEDGAALEVIASALAVFYQEADREDIGISKPGAHTPERDWRRWFRPQWRRNIIGPRRTTRD